MTARLEATRVDLPGLLQVLGKNLYSTPAVAMRELVQNAHDSCVRRRIESEAPFEAWITVTATPGRIEICDAGAGLTDEELERDLATIGRGYTRTLREKGEANDLIGMFGLGFLTAFVVSRRVEVFTTSYQTPDQTWHFASDNGQRFTIQPHPTTRAVGTTVVLHLAPAFEHLAEPDAIAHLVEHYCALLPTPVFLDGARQQRANVLAPWWRQDPAPTGVKKTKADLALARHFERTFDPICAYDLEGDGHRGTLWIQDGSTYATSDNRNMSVFVRGMLVSDDARKLVPPWAGFVGGVIESERLAPTASREELCEDDVFEEVQALVRDTLIAGLRHTARHDPANWRRILRRHNEALLGAALSDPQLFEIVVDDLTVPTSAGDLTMATVAKRSEGTIYVSLGERGAPEETLFSALLVPVVTGTRFAAFPFAKRVAGQRGYRVVELGTEHGNRALFRDAELEDGDALRALLEDAGVEGMSVQLAHFEPTYLPLVVVPDREAQMKARIESDDADRRIGSAALGLARMFTAKIDERPEARLYVNVDAPVVRQLLDAEPSRRASGAQLLVAFAKVMASQGADSVVKDVRSVLETINASVEALLKGT